MAAVAPSTRCFAWRSFATSRQAKGAHRRSALPVTRPGATAARAAEPNRDPPPSLLIPNSSIQFLSQAFELKSNDLSPEGGTNQPTPQLGYQIGANETCASPRVYR